MTNRQKRWIIVYKRAIIDLEKTKDCFLQKEKTMRIKLEELEKTNFFVRKAECHKQNWKNDSEWTGYAHAPRKTNALILVCSDMHMRFRFHDGKTVTAKQGDIVFVPKDTAYVVRFERTSNKLDSYTVNFSLFDQSGEEIEIAENLSVLSEKYTKRCLFAVEEFFEAYVTNRENKVKCNARFYSFLDSVCELISQKRPFYYPIKKGVALLKEEWNLNKSVDDYAAASGVDRSYFYKLFKAWSCVSPNEYRNKLRIAVAKSALKSTNASVREIAEQTGFDDPYYFSRTFKKYVGVSPMQYRKINL